MASRWQITLLGALRAEQGSHTLVNFRRQKTGILLAYLAYFPQRAHPREALIELLWPDADLAAGRLSLSVALSFLRQNMELPGSPPGSVLVADRAAVRLHPDAIETDVIAFESALREASRAEDAAARGHHLQGAAERYGGELLPGCYDEWALRERERLAEAYLDALFQLIRLHEARGDLSGALEHARRAVSADPLREEGHQALIRLLATTGQPRAARQQFGDMERRLREIDTVPSNETRALLASLGEAARGKEGDEAEDRWIEAFGLDVPSPRELPSGTVTFLLTVMERGAEPRERLGEAARRLLESHHALLRRIFCEHGGWEVAESGDGFVVAFQGAGDALACAIALQRALVAATHADARVPGGPVEMTGRSGAGGLLDPPRVHAALHTGEAYPRQGTYRTVALHLAQRILDAGHGGQILCSEASASLLRRELEPGTRLVDRGIYLLPGLSEPERLFEVAYPGMADGSFPPLRAEARPGSHLPLTLTRFFGRDAERESLGKLLTPEGGRSAPRGRLVTLLGPGGSGKSRLALEMARQLAPERHGVIALVPLADLTEPGRIADVVRQTLRLAPSASADPWDTIVEALSDEPALLVLDNLEQLLPEGAGEIHTLLSRAPNVTCVVTSRRRLDLPEERVFTVEPLPVPPAALPELGALLEVPSVQLFVDRARAARPEFALTAANMEAIAALCRRLEGLPLAIELAAARVGVLTPAQMLTQLDRGLGMLATRREDMAARHRSLRATVEWSYRLLDPSLQQFFAGISVFRGGFSLEAAEAISGEPLALDYLEQLRECSLLLAEETPAQSVIGSGPAAVVEMRFRLLETLREYAAEQLGADDQQALRERHAEHFLAWAEHVRAEQRAGREIQAWNERLTIEHDNLRAAMTWAVEQREAEVALRLARSLALFWEFHGHLTEGRQRIAAALSLADASTPREGASQTTLSTRAWVLRGAGTLAWRQSDYGPARSALDESLALHRQLGDLAGVVATLHILGAVTFNQGDFAASRAFGVQALEAARELGDEYQIAIALHNLANVARAQSDLDTARPYYAECLAIFRKVATPVDVAYALHGLGMLDHYQGEWQSARAYYEECLKLRREAGHQQGVGDVLDTLGILDRDQGDYPAATAHLDESLSIRKEVGEMRGIGSSLYGLGSVAVCTGNPRARALLEESLAIHRKQGDLSMAAFPLLDLGILLRRGGEPGLARSLLEESLTRFREAGDRQGIGLVCCQLGALAADGGDVEAASAQFAESLNAFCPIGERFGIAQALEGFARLAGIRGDHPRAAHLDAAAAALRETLGAPIPPVDRAAYDDRQAATRAALGEAAFAAAWAEGQAMTLEETITRALAGG